MRITAVLDVLAGNAVRAIAGERASYRPWNLPFLADASPLTAAEYLRRTFGCETLYLADLDAIAGRPPNRDVWCDLLAAGFRLRLDAGLPNAAPLLAADADLRSRSPQANRLEWIVPLECWDGTSLRPALAALGAERLAFSLDLRHGRLAGTAWRPAFADCPGPATNLPPTEMDALFPSSAGRLHPAPTAKPGEWAEIAPPPDSLDETEIADEILRRLHADGVRRWILLDTARVGTRCGSDERGLFARVRRQYPAIHLTTGGGIRDRADLLALQAAGCAAALVATALFEGTLSPADLIDFRQERGGTETDSAP